MATPPPETFIQHAHRLTICRSRDPEIQWIDVADDGGTKVLTFFVLGSEFKFRLGRKDAAFLSKLLAPGAEREGGSE